MVVYITNDVKKTLNKYRNSLNNYPISRQRAHEKYNNMVDALLSLGNNQNGCSLCVHKKLGQLFDNSGNPIYTNLYRFNYTDSSNFQWAFALIIDRPNDKITITKMMSGRFVTEMLKRMGVIISEEIRKYLKSAAKSLAQFKIKTGTNVFPFYVHLCHVSRGG